MRIETDADGTVREVSGDEYPQQVTYRFLTGTTVTKVYLDMYDLVGTTPEEKEGKESMGKVLVP